MPPTTIRHRLLLVGLALVIAALLAACAAQPAATATATLTFLPSLTPSHTAPPSATPTVIPTRTPWATLALSPLPTYTPSLTPSATRGQPEPMPRAEGSVTPIALPSGGVAAYVLKPATASARLDLLRELEAYSLANNYFWIFALSPGYTGPQIAISFVAQGELALFPASPESVELRWRQAFADAVAGDTASDGWIISQLEAELNAAGGDVPALSALAARHGFRVEQIEAAPNLFGDGAAASVIWLTTAHGDWDGLFLAAHPMPAGGLDLRLIRSDWRFDSSDDGLLIPRDLTGDGRPEVPLMIGTHSGTMCAGQLEIYRWQRDRFVNLATGPANPYGIEYLDCFPTVDYGGSEASGPATVTLGDFDFVHNLNYQYQLGPDGYVLASVRPEPTERYSEFNNDWRSAAWEAGDYAGVAAQVEPLLNHAVPPFGPAYSAYLRFQHGVALAFYGDVVAAQADLQAVISTTRVLSTPALSLAAQAYLFAYRTPADIYRACDQALVPMQAALAAQTPEPDGSGVDYQAAWGYYPGYVNTEVCSLRAALMALVRQWGPDDLANAPARLQAAGVRIGATLQLDLDGDGSLEWVVTTGTYHAHHPWEAWVLLVTESGLRALPVDAWEDRLCCVSNAAPSSWPSIDVLDLPGATQPVLLVDLADSVRIIRLYNAAGVTRIINVLDRPGVADYAFRSMGLTMDLSFFYPKGLTVYTETYRWDAERQAFFWYSSPPETAAIEAAEPLLLDPARRAEAVAIFQAALADANEYKRPYILYSLGLAAELDGDAAQAASLYWQLWHDYPGSIYGFTAREKLMPVP